MIYVIAIGAFQALTGILLLWKNRSRSKADTLLILLLLCIATHLAIKFYIFNFIQDGHVRAQMNTFIGCCYGPLLYLYALKNKDQSFIPASRWYVFLPFIAGAVGYLTVICVLTFSAAAGYSALELYNRTSTWLFISNNIIFALLAMHTAKSLEGMPEQLLIKRVGYAMLLLGAVSTLFSVIGIPFGHNHDLICRGVIYSILVGICIIIIGHKYVGLMAPALPAPVIQELAEQAVETIAIARKTQLSTAEQEKIWEQLETCLQNRKIFTDPDLSLEKLAHTLSVSKHHLSETLNSYAGKSFYQYVNEWRIRYVLDQMKLLHGKGLPVNILTLAYNCGFKAKSSFNQYFKKITGVTPTEYYKSFAAVSN